MKILALDTSTEWLSVALFDGENAIAMRERAGNASSGRILPAIGEILAQGGTSLAQLDGIAYGAGPGSFTGVRIACGVVQGLAFGASLPVFGVPTLGAIAQSAWRAHRARRIVACLDARMREVYVATYVRNGDGWALVREAAVCKPDEVEPPSSKGWHGAGDGFAAYPRLESRLHLAACDPSIIPDAQSIAEWAWPQLLAGEGISAEQARPLYVRHRIALTSAERAAGMRLRGTDAMASLPIPTPLAPVQWRPLAAHDLPVVAALEARIHAAPWSERNFRDAFAAGYSARVGVRADRIVAYGVLMLGPGEAQLLNLSVVPEARRTGLGRTLLMQFVGDARCLGAEQLFLEVRIGNLGAIALYETVGFTSVARRIEYYPPARRGGVREDAQVMRCDLRLLPRP